MAYKKVFLRGGAEVKEFDRGKVVKVGMNFDDLVGRVKSGEIKLSESGTLYFDIVEKKAEKQKDGEATHYLVQSQKISDEEERERQAKANEDLPFK